MRGGAPFSSVPRVFFKVVIPGGFWYSINCMSIT